MKELDHLPGCAAAANMTQPRSLRLIGPRCDCAERRKVAEKFEAWLESDEAQEELKKIGALLQDNGD